MQIIATHIVELRDHVRRDHEGLPLDRLLSAAAVTRLAYDDLPSWARNSNRADYLWHTYDVLTDMIGELA